jgi:hypothetical protein
MRGRGNQTSFLSAISSHILIRSLHCKMMARCGYQTLHAPASHLRVLTTPARDAHVNTLGVTVLVFLLTEKGLIRDAS